MAHHKKKYEIQNNNAKYNKSRREFNSTYKGLFLTLLAGMLYSLVSVMVKYLKNLNPGQLSVYRFIALLAFTLPQAVKSGEDLLGPKSFRFLLILRGIIGATELYLMFIAYKYLTLGEAEVIISSNPIFVALAAKLLLKEPCKVFQIITVVTTVTGIIISTNILQLVTENAIVYTRQSIYGIVSAAGSVILCSFRYVIVRKLRTVHHSVIMLHFGIFGIIEMVILTALFGSFNLHNCGHQWLYIILIGIFGYGGPALHTIALQCELAGPVSTITAASRILLAFLWQVLFFKDIPDLYSSIGAVLVGVSIIFVSIEKIVSSLNEDSPYRKKMSWILK